MPSKFKLSPEALQQIADIGAEYLRDMIDARIDARGNPLPPGVTLYRTGSLYRSIRGDVTDGGVPVVIVAKHYSVFINKHYQINAIAPQFTQEFYRRVQGVISGGLTLESI